MTFRAGWDFEIIDSHQHFIDVDRFDYYWMKNLPDVLHRSFGPREVSAEMIRAGVCCSVAVQAHPSEPESRHLVELAAKFPFISGVVASVDLADPSLDRTLRSYSRIAAIRAVRHQQAENQDARWFLRPEVLRGFEAVEKSGLRYDFLCRAPQLRSAAEVAKKFPGLTLILEHAGKPPIKSREFAPWAEAIDLLSPAANVCCKLSELITQADWSSWTPRDVQPYVAHAAEALGYDRLIWGSGWPICLLASSYEETITCTLAGLPDATPRELKLVFRDNAARWYGLNM